jgi:iron-sulfur cluster assembly protein
MTLISINQKQYKKTETKIRKKLLIKLSKIKNDNFTISKDAAKQILIKLKKHNKINGFLRISVHSGGCAGLNYKFRLKKQRKKNDHIFSTLSAHVIIDHKSFNFLKNSILHWHIQNMKSSFIIITKNKNQQCSCGKSFAI